PFRSDQQPKATEQEMATQDGESHVRSPDGSGSHKALTADIYSIGRWNPYLRNHAFCIECPWMIGEQCRGTTGVQEQQRALARKGTSSNAVEQAGKGLAGVHRIEQHAFMFGKQANRRQGSGVRFTIAWCEILVPQIDLQPRRCLHTEQLGSTLQQPIDL